MYLQKLADNGTKAKPIIFNATNPDSFDCLSNTDDIQMSKVTAKVTTV